MAVTSKTLQLAGTALVTCVVTFAASQFVDTLTAKALFAERLAEHQRQLTDHQTKIEQERAKTDRIELVLERQVAITESLRDMLRELRDGRSK